MYRGIEHIDNRLRVSAPGHLQLNAGSFGNADVPAETLQQRRQREGLQKSR